jgi:hypothetical protein
LSGCHEARQAISRDNLYAASRELCRKLSTGTARLKSPPV